MLVPYSSPRFQALDSSGQPMSGAALHIFINRTTIVAQTWSDQDQITQNANPILLDARGEAVIWLDPDKSYTFVLRDSVGGLVWSQDDISGAVSSEELLGEGGSDNVGFIQTGNGAVKRSVADKLRDTINIMDFGAVGDGVTDDLDAVLAFVAECRARNVKGVFEARPYYIGGGSIDISGVTLEGVYRGHRNVAGTRIIGDGTAIILSQDNISTPNHYFDLKNIRVEKALTGLSIRYGLYSRLTNIDIFEPQGDGWLLGDASLSVGTLGVYADRVNVWNSKGDGLKIQGATWNNSNVFFRCWLQTASPDKSCVDLSVDGGFGALSNRFVKSQLSGVGAGMTIRRAGALVLDQMYMETQGPAIRILGSAQLEVRSPVFGSLVNNNVYSEPNYIHHVSGTGRVYLVNPWITLGSGSDQDSLALAGSDEPGDFFLNIDGLTTSAISASGWELLRSNLHQSNINMSVRSTHATVWSTSGTAPEVGNGTLSMTVNRNGTTVTVTLRLVFGTTTTSGPGGWTFTLPYAVRSLATGVGYALSGHTRYTVLASLSGTTLSLWIPNTSNSVSANQPFTWSAGDSLAITTTYQL